MRGTCICLFIVLFIFIRFDVKAKVYTRCGLTQELLNNGFSRTLVGNWVCLIENESHLNTSKETARANGSKSLGLFQINSKQWCTFGRPGGECAMKCEDLLNENILDDSACAKKIQEEAGFRAWQGWERNCKGRNYPSQIVSACLPKSSGNSFRKRFTSIFDLE